MTTARLPTAGSPRLDDDCFQIGRTVRAGDGAALVAAINDACLQTPGQVLSWGPRREGVFSLFLLPDTPSLYWRLSLGVGWDVQPYNANSVSVEVVIYDFSGNSYALPAPLDGTLNIPPLPAGDRLASVRFSEYYVSKASALAAGLLDTDPWRVEVTIKRDGDTAMVHLLSLEEVPRFVVDDSEAWGVIPGTVLPRQPVRDVDQLTRLLATLEYAETRNRRTHLCLAASEEGRRYTGAAPAAWDPLTTYASGDLASVGGVVYRSIQGGNLGNVPADTASDPGGAGWWATALYTTTGAATSSLLNLEEASGTELTFWTRPRLLDASGSRAVRVFLRYRIDGDDGELVVTTGAGATPTTLLDTGGAWTDLELDPAALAVAAIGDEDTVRITGSHAGTPAVEVCALTVVEG